MSKKKISMADAAAQDLEELQGKFKAGVSGVSVIDEMEDVREYLVACLSLNKQSRERGEYNKIIPASMIARKAIERFNIPIKATGVVDWCRKTHPELYKHTTRR